MKADWAHYLSAVKCNDNKTLLTLLSRAGTGFDCASKKEMQQILQLGVNPERIIFAAPRKAEDHINYAHEHGIDKIVVDSEDELRKLAEIVPSATIFLRLRADDPTSRVRLSEKFGSDLLEARGILQVFGRRLVSQSYWYLLSCGIGCFGSRSLRKSYRNGPGSLRL